MSITVNKEYFLDVLRSEFRDKENHMEVVGTFLVLALMEINASLDLMRESLYQISQNTTPR